ncbi:hypothetical protein Rs2_22795 [Raphanus sativus]|nr:hypothetical protein Rs2_22795 [Raphanus sativus]
MDKGPKTHRAKHKIQKLAHRPNPNKSRRRHASLHALNPATRKLCHHALGASPAPLLEIRNITSPFTESMLAGNVAATTVSPDLNVSGAPVPLNFVCSSPESFTGTIPRSPTG